MINIIPTVIKESAILKIKGKRYRSLYGRWIECDSKGVYLSRSGGRNVVKFKKNEKK